MAKKAFFGHFRQKWPFWPLFQQNCPVATGLKFPENPKIGVFPQKASKIPDFRTPRGPLLHQPLAEGPCTRDFGDFGPRPGGVGISDLREVPEGLQPRTPGGGSPAGDRAPPRGVDVKPPSRGRPVPDTWSGRSGKALPRPGGAPWAREPGIPDPGIGSQDPSGARGTRGTPRSRAHAPRRPPRQGLFYINPSRRGPVAPPGPQVVT